MVTPTLLAHQGLVVHGSEEGVLLVPAASAEVLEAGQAPAEVGPVAESAKVAEDVVQVGVDLNLPDKWMTRSRGRHSTAQRQCSRFPPQPTRFDSYFPKVYYQNFF